MAEQSGEAQSQLYLLRIWTAPGPDGTAGYRGKLQPVLSDDSYFFAGGHELLALLASLLLDTATLDPDQATPDPRPAQES